MQFLNIAHPQMLRCPPSPTRFGVGCIGVPFGRLAFGAINIHKLHGNCDKKV